MSKLNGHGHKSAPAPIGEWQARMRSALYEALDEDAIHDVVSAMVDRAKKGDIQAARLVLTYAIGNPTVNVRNAVIVGGQAATNAGLAPLPTRPTAALPGSTEKMDVFAARARNGQPMGDPRDRERDAG